MATIKEIAEIVGVSGAVTVTLIQVCLLWMSENGLSGRVQHISVTATYNDPYRYPL